MHSIELGSTARDRVSNWEGTVTARYEYMNGCERHEVSGADKDGKPEAFVFDAQQIEVLAAPHAALVRQPQPVVRTGGPRDSSPVARP